MSGITLVCCAAAAAVVPAAVVVSRSGPLVRWFSIIMIWLSVYQSKALQLEYSNSISKCTYSRSSDIYGLRSSAYQRKALVLEYSKKIQEYMYKYIHIFICIYSYIQQQWLVSAARSSLSLPLYLSSLSYSEQLTHLSIWLSVRPCACYHISFHFNIQDLYIKMENTMSKTQRNT